MYKRYIKRLLDIIGSLTAIIILLPVYILIAFAVFFGMGHPVLFAQERIGQGGKIFKLYKFRSMTDARDNEGNLLEEEKRLTKLGIFLRSSSLDELPELFLILKGDMSFIGPRPLPTYYAPYFYKKEWARHKVRGGLIPPDSLSHKVFTTWEEQFEYEVYYAEHVSLLLDIRVMVTTLEILVKRVIFNYGAEFRPHLNVYRKSKMGANDEVHQAN